MRADGRLSEQLRPTRITPNYSIHAEGSVLIDAGKTRVICTASVEDRVPPFRRNTGKGWVTAEYGMLPRATSTRSQRESTAGKVGGRTQEIQRLIGRSLRAVTKLEELGERTVTLDCDVLQADGGTRTASITGAFVALVFALNKMREQDMIRTMPVIEGAADALWRLSDAGIWLRIITHRLYVNWAHERAVGDTAAWLDEHRIPYRDLCFLGAKPEVQADAYIDDAPHNITALRQLGNTVIVFEQPYNLHLSDGPRARNWVEAESIVADLAAVNLGQVAVQLPGIDAGSARLQERRRVE